MRVLIIANGIDADKPGLSGGEVRFIEISKYWARQGHQIELLSNRGGREICERLGLKITRFYSSSTITLPGRLGFVLKTIQAFFFLPKDLANFEGIIYSTNEMIFDVVPALKIKRKSKGGFIVWGVVVHWLPPFPPWARRQSTVLNSTLFFLNQRLSLLLANRYADKLLAVSQSTHRDVIQWGAVAEKVVEVACGVNTDQLRPFVDSGHASKHYDAVFMKRLQAVKGIFDVIEAWAVVCSELADARLLIIGEGIDGKRARELVTQLGLEKNVIFTGPIFDFQYKFTLLSRCKLFVLPTYEENWAIVIGEALGIGLPVITYNLKELTDVWGDSINTVEVGNVGSLAASILKLIKCPDLLWYEVERAKKNIGCYDWENISVNEMEQLVGTV